MILTTFCFCCFFLPLGGCRVIVMSQLPSVTHIVHLSLLTSSALARGINCVAFVQTIFVLGCLADGRSVSTAMVDQLYRHVRRCALVLRLYSLEFAVSA